MTLLFSQTEAGVSSMWFMKVPPQEVWSSQCDEPMTETRFIASMP